MIINKNNFIDYTLLLLVLAVSGMPHFQTSMLFAPLFIILFIIYFLRKKRLDWMFVLLSTLLLIVTIFQTFIFDFYSIQTISGVFLRVFIAYLIVKILGEKFIPYFINILYIIAIISLIVFIPLLLVPALGTPLLNIASSFNIINFSPFDQSSILIYNLSHLEKLRNSGPFWEPGAFAGYLLLAYMFNFYSKDKYKKRKGMFLLFAIITTLSTTATLALFVFFFFAFYNKMKNVLIRVMVIFIILAGGYYAFTGLDFLGEKIESQMEFAQTQGIVRSDNSQRFLNILRDAADLKDHEIFGRGSNPITRYSFGPLDQIRTVGLTDILVRMGIPLFLLIMYFIYRSICSYLVAQRQRNIFNCVGVFVTILVTLMSEPYFNYPIYWSLLFIQFIYKEEGRL